YVIGGVNTANTRTENEMYDPQTNTWSAKAPLAARRESFAAQAMDGKIYLIGGLDGSGNFQSLNEEYDPQADTWATKAPMPAPRSQIAAATQGGKIYVFGGWDGNFFNIKSMTEVYDPVSNIWAKRANMGLGRRQAAAAAANGKIYVISGSFGTNSDLADNNEEYDPGTSNKFINLTPGAGQSFKAKARNSQGIETAETTVLSSFTAAFIPLAIDTGSFSNVSISSLATSWLTNGNSPGTSYYVWLSTGVNSTTQGWAAFTSTGFTNLLTNATYYGYVKARNGDHVETSWTSLGSTVTLAAPPATTASTFTALSTSAIAISWSANNNPLGTIFIAEISSYPGFSPLAASSATLVTASTFTSLTPNTTYYFQAKARSHAGLESSYTQLGSTVTKANPVSALAFSSVSTTTIASNWTRNSNPLETSFLVQLATSSSFASVSQTSVTLTTSALFTDLLVNATYYARVQAIGAQGEGTTFTNLGSTSTLVNPPACLVSTFSIVTINSIAFSWHSNNNSTGTIFIAEISSYPGFSPLAASSATIVTASTFTSLTPNTTYYFQAKARSHAGLESSYTQLGSTVTKANPVSALAFSSVSTTTIASNWTRNSNPLETSFLVQLATSSSFASVSQTSVTLTTSALFTDLLVNATYYARVQAANAQGEGTGFEDLGSTCTLANPPALFNYTSALQSSITIAWSADFNSNGTVYFLEVSTKANFGPLLLSSQTLLNSILLDNLSANTTYYAQVKARNHGNLETAYLDLGSTVTLAAQPGVQNFSGVTAGALRANWTDMGNGPETVYFAQLDDDPNFTSINRSSITNNTYADFLSLAANTSHYARVQSLNWAGSGTDFTDLGSTPTLSNAPVTSVSAFGYLAISSLAFQWSVNNNPQGTRFVMEISSFVGFSPLAASSVTVLDSVALTGLTPNTTYYAQVKALNHSGLDSSYAVGRASVTLAAPPASAIPTYTMVAVSSITYQWDANSNPQGTFYIAEISSGADFYLLANSSATTTLPIITFTDLIANTTYYARVKAVNSAKTNTHFILLGSTVTRAGPISAMAFTNLDTTQLQANWTLGDNPLSTLFQAELDDDAAFGSINRASVTAVTNALFSGLFFNTTYYARVQTINIAAERSDFVSLGSTPTLAFPPVRISTTLAAFPSVYISSLPAIWSPNSNPPGTAFIAEISSYPGFSPLAASSATEVSVATFTNLAPNTTYYVQVKARNHSGFDTLYVYLGSTVTMASPVEAMPFSSVSTTAIAGNWTQGSNPPGTKFQAELAAHPSFTSVIQTSVTLKATAFFAGLSVNTTYYIRTQAINIQGERTAFTELGSTSTLTNKPLTINPVFSEVKINSMAMQWNPSDNPLGTMFVTEISSVSGFEPIAGSSSTVLSAAMFENLTPNTTYYARAKARSHAGADTAYTLLGSTVTKANPVLALAFSFVSTAAIAGNWTPSANPPGTRYKALLALNPSFNTIAKTSVTLNTTALFAGLSL
ncbi:MAG: fibronectin type III domain-containing protein, partial [Elusimicrobiota bacterium]